MKPVLQAQTMLDQTIHTSRYFSCTAVSAAKRRPANPTPNKSAPSSTGPRHLGPVFVERVDWPARKAAEEFALQTPLACEGQVEGLVVSNSSSISGHPTPRLQKTPNKRRGSVFCFFQHKKKIHLIKRVSLCTKAKACKLFTCKLEARRTGTIMTREKNNGDNKSASAAGQSKCRSAGSFTPDKQLNTRHEG